MATVANCVWSLLNSLKHCVKYYLMLFILFQTIVIVRNYNKAITKNILNICYAILVRCFA